MTAKDLPLKYLNSELKQYYQSDFENLTKNKDENFWNLDKGIVQDLKRINENNYLSTIYSKKFSWPEDKSIMVISGISYIQFVYRKEVEEELLKVVTELEKEFSSIAETNFFLFPPQESVIYSPESRFDIGCMKNPDYFNLYHWKLEIDSLDLKVHNEFWNSITAKLSEIEPLRN